MNRLASATSPYLQQHADNPVDWWEWGPEAFAEAKRRDVPLLISVGYSACHWCHVMAHESFEDPAIAEVVNRLTVPVKVDREERPDVDAVYMAATQATTGQGGWPMTVFATPDGEPFYCGTYFRKGDFVQLVEAVGKAWAGQREEVLAQGRAIVEAVRPGTSASGDVSAGLLGAGVSKLRAGYDDVNGGFGTAPKFPPSMVLLFLLRHHERTGSIEALEMARHTCEQMARGGMYDQLAGGFARYSVDAQWTVPHFEKMLYDNALLLRAYTQLWKITGDPLAARVARETAAFMVRDFVTPEGGFAAAFDADTDGVEGLTYAWTPQQLTDVLGEEDGAWAADLFRVTAAGTFEHGTSVLQLSRDVDDSPSPRLAGIKARLLAARDERPQPGRDDKLVAAWNGLAITALCEFGAIFGDEAALAAATRAGDLLARLHMTEDGRVLRVSRDGVAGTPKGVLEDYGCLAEAFCALHQVTAGGRWLTAARSLLDTALAQFGDGDGGYFDTAADGDALVVRPRDPADNASPAGVTALAGALTTYTALSGETAYREAAEKALATTALLIGNHPRFGGWAAAVAEAQLTGPWEVAVAGGGPLELAAWRTAPGGSVVVSGAPDAEGVPLLADRPLVDGAAAAYTCKGFVCERPVTDAASLTQIFGRA
ncbi:thioredoxin domain-containing protein [Longispora albida]|uniref:thioredoxin domain-containing protein n=1 Tax=Longispora albida TaxID=203523 RepID=UPI00036FAAA0|nr:thioredoxin domain-containing protein [Longispora albida]